MSCMMDSEFQIILVNRKCIKISLIMVFWEDLKKKKSLIRAPPFNSEKLQCLESEYTEYEISSELDFYIS